MSETSFCSHSFSHRGRGSARCLVSNMQTSLSKMVLSRLFLALTIQMVRGQDQKSLCHPGAARGHAALHRLPHRGSGSAGSQFSSRFCLCRSLGGRHWASHDLRGGHVPCEATLQKDRCAVTPHMLRHTRATLWISRQADVTGEKPLGCSDTPAYRPPMTSTCI